MATPIEDVIENNITDPNDQATARVFSGFRGRDPYQGWTRVYLNDQLSEYVDVNGGDIVNTVDLGGANSPLILIFVKPNAQINHVVLAKEQVEADFLAGEIAQENLGGSRMAGASWFGGNATLMAQSIGCGSLGRACGSLGRACGSLGRACGSIAYCP